MNIQCIFLIYLYSLRHYDPSVNLSYQMQRQNPSFFEKYHQAQDLASCLDVPISQFKNQYAIELQNLRFPVNLPDQYYLHDFSRGPDPSPLPYSIGKFDENRVALYHQDLFQSQGDPRTIHVGIDIGAPVHTEVLAVMDGVIEKQGYLAENGDYGHLLITKHRLTPVANTEIWVLYGHLSADSILHQPQKIIKKGEVIARIGSESENGGWFPHLHIQFSRIPPIALDLPGVVSASHHSQALEIYFNPFVLENKSKNPIK